MIEITEALFAMQEQHRAPVFWLFLMQLFQLSHVQAFMYSLSNDCFLFLDKHMEGLIYIG